MNIAINGFGRIGRAAFQIILDKYAKVGLNVVAINDLTDTATLAHLFQYDTTAGKLDQKIKGIKDYLLVGGTKYRVLAEKDPSQLPWKELKVDVVLECTGRFRTKEEAALHLQAGAKKVIISAPAKGDEGVATIVLGVNENTLKKNDNIISCASCTTNCLAPVTEMIRSQFGIKKSFISTVHAYTADQNLVDGPHKDLRRARAAAANIVPTTTGAAKAIGKTIPSLKGKVDGLAIRVPVLVGSLVDVVYLLNKRTDAAKVNKAFSSFAKTSKYKDIVEVSSDPLVSSDIIGNPHSAIIDTEYTTVIDGDFLKVLAWYDNEWGYSNRLADLCFYLQKKKYI
jgi:glyceraldehyde 3-phosphate dehydrogenase